MQFSNQLRKIAKPFVSPDIYDFWLGKLVSNASWETPLATVMEVRKEARDAVSLVLKPNRHFAGFRSGQHINVTVEVDGVRCTRSYSITTTPKLFRQQRRIAITVKRFEGGTVSTHLCREMTSGSVVEISQAFGEMTVAAGSEPILLLAAGSGITPMMSIVRKLTGDGPGVCERPLTLLYWAQVREDFCFYDELQQLAEDNPAFQLQFILTRETDLLAEEKTGRPSRDLMDTLVPVCSDHRVFACGPTGFVECVRGLVEHQAQSFVAESFSPVQPRAIAPGSAEEVTVTLSRSNRTVTLPTSISLLEALEEKGVRPASGCRRGICNTCACGKTEGISANLISGDESHHPATALRLCVSAARSDLVLDL